MSVKVMSWVWEHSQAEGNDKFVLLAIADRANDEGADAWPAIGTLAKKCGLSERTVQRCLLRLVELGELQIEEGAGRRGTHLFFVPMVARHPLEQPSASVSAHPQPIAGGVTDCHPRQIDTPDTVTGEGCQADTGGVTPCHRGGVTVSPDPSSTSSTSSTSGGTRAREAADAPPTGVVVLSHDRPRRPARQGLLRGPDPTCYRDGPGPLGVPHRLHTEFVELRTARGMPFATAVAELDAFYGRWVEAYTTGDRRGFTTEMDRFKFWRARHVETWPPSATGLSGQLPPPGPAVQSAAATRRMLAELDS